MAGAIAERIGPYRVVRELGRGGMGVVYLAHDTRLDRDVAIKVLPEELAGDRQRLARFKREARLLASLNHPNIAGVYGLEDADAVRCLILEYVEGLTLQERLKRGRLPLDDALSIGKQIAEAVEAAHEKGVVHRDIKPANVKVTLDGHVKVLDFGLAKALHGEAVSVDTDLADSPTVTMASGATVPGVILGTAGYMSPEQARGKPVDRRTDIWSFGCVLYECLAGTMAFSAETVSDSIAAILHTEPDWSSLPRDTPPTVRLLLRRCLAKERRKRLHAIADARIELEEAAADPTGSSLGLMAQASRRPSREAARPIQLAIPLPHGLHIAHFLSRPVAISPDGTHVVFVGSTSPRDLQLYLRRLDRPDANPIRGTEGGFDPFISPDGRWIGFLVEEDGGRRLKRVAIDGGPPVPITDSSTVLGAVWGPDGAVYFPDNDVRRPAPTCPIVRVPAAGGSPEPVTRPGPGTEDCYHYFPEILPDGKSLLFATCSDRRFTASAVRLQAQRLETGERKTLLEGVVVARYAPTGHVVFARQGTLMAAPIDLDRLELVGPESVMIDGVRTGNSGAANFAFSQNGTLVYLRGARFQEVQRTIHFVDQHGRLDRTISTRGLFFQPRLSPDGRRLAVSRMSSSDRWDVWVIDLDRETWSRLTFGGWDGQPVWTPDGKSIAFVSGRWKRGARDLYLVPADGSGEPELLLKGETFAPNSFAPDGSVLAFSRLDPGSGESIWILPLEGKREPFPFVQSPFGDFGAEFSPDGRWLAYTSTESGEKQVYVRPFPGPGPKWQISTDGGSSPAWARNGTQLFYCNADAVMVVDVATEPDFSASAPRLLFEGRFGEFGEYFNSRNYDVSPDGERFVMMREEEAVAQIQVVLNWFEALKERVQSQ